MAADLTDYAKNKILEHFVGKTAWTMPTVYVGLTTSTVNESATELSGNAYARVAIGTCATASSGATENSADISFTAASGNWGTVTGFALFDASSTGNRLTKWKALTASQTVNSGGTFKFPTGNLDVTIP